MAETRDVVIENVKKIRKALKGKFIYDEPIKTDADWILAAYWLGRTEAEKGENTLER